MTYRNNNKVIKGVEKNWLRLNDPQAATTYHREYMKRWLEDPINKECHAIRMQLRYILRAPRGKTIDHILGIRLLLAYEIPRYIINDKINIQFLPQKGRKSNSSKGSKITRKAISVASKLERKYPVECAGLRMFVIAAKWSQK